MHYLRLGLALCSVSVSFCFAAPVPTAQNLTAEQQQKIEDSLSQGDEAAAHQELVRLAEEGNAQAQSFLGAWYFTQGQQDTRSYREAFKWFSRAAKQGYGEAQYRLGEMYFYDYGIGKQSDRQAAKWWLASAEGCDVTPSLDCVKARNNLGMLYAHGIGVKKNQDDAKFWLTKVAEQHHDPLLRAIALENLLRIM
ncbi:tetratricopeptide repeat protein [Stenoxybacter acetivorans]|uniref:tetratricopeptide repeat protein n=1 Tax=Stenoxybacter acetivorans TaxID=422441 RepID=UPI0006916421|nr:tetratricopeptide repeat protein [Stenoxybacter acetivorans]